MGTPSRRKHPSYTFTQSKSSSVISLYYYHYHYYHWPCYTPTAVDVFHVIIEGDRLTILLINIVLLIFFHAPQTPTLHFWHGLRVILHLKCENMNV